MRSGIAALSMVSALVGCAADPGETAVDRASAADAAGGATASPSAESVDDDPPDGLTQDDFDWPSLPSGACEDRCYEAYLNDIAECKRLPRDRRQPCYAQASVKHGECRKRCNPREPEDSMGAGSEPPEQLDPGDPFSGLDSDR